MTAEAKTPSQVIRETTLVLSYDHEEHEVCVEQRESFPYEGYLNRHSSPDEQMAWIVRGLVGMDMPLSGLKPHQRVRFVITIEEYGDDAPKAPEQECGYCGHKHNKVGGCPQCGMPEWEA